jgi:hypothetical protein
MGQPSKPASDDIELIQRKTKPPSSFLNLKSQELVQVGFFFVFKRNIHKKIVHQNYTIASYLL